MNGRMSHTYRQNATATTVHWLTQLFNTQWIMVLAKTSQGNECESQCPPNLTVPLCVCCLKKLWEEQKGSGWMGHGWSHVNHNGRLLSIPQEPFHWIVFGRKLGKNLGFVHGRISRSPLTGSEFREWIKIILPCFLYLLSIIQTSKTSHN